MERYREKTSTFFTRLGRKQCQRPAIRGRSPAPQTSLILELPDELILSILSHIAPDPRLVGRHARYRTRRGQEIDSHHWQRVRFLRPLSMTCRAMWLRFAPWVWERLQLLPPDYLWLGAQELTSFGKLNSIASVLCGNESLATNYVRSITVHFPHNGLGFPSFVKCLESLRNLHTLEVGWLAPHLMISPPKTAFKGIKLPQIKTLILPPAAYPFLRHCRNVVDVVLVARYDDMSPYKFIESLASNRNSKVKRLAIPLTLWVDPSRLMAACPGLTELTIVCPLSLDAQISAAETLFDRARSAISELVNACKALPDFDTLQIIYSPAFPRSPMCGCGRLWCSNHRSSVRRSQALGGYMKNLKDWAIDCLQKSNAGFQEGECRRKVGPKEYVKGAKEWAIDRLKKPEAGVQEGEGRKTITLRVITLTWKPLRWMFYEGSVKVEEYEV